MLGFSGQQGLMRPPIVSPRSTQTSIPPPLIPTSYRPLRPFAGELIAPPRGFPAADPTGVAALASTSFESSGTYRPRGGTQPARGLAWALLRTNFVLVKTSPLFRQALGLSGAGMTDTRLTEMLVEHDWNKIERLERIMQEERTFRDPAYLPPIYAGNEAENIQQVGEDELVELTHGSREREEELTFRRPDEQLRTISAQFKLAKKSIYFVVMTLNPEGPLVQSLPEPLSLAYQQGQPSRPAVPFSSYGLPMPPSSYGGPSRPGPPPSRYSDSGSPPYPLSDPSHFAARTPDLHSPRLTRQAFGTFAEEPHPPRDAGSLAVALSWEPRTASSAPSRRASAPHTQHRPQVGEYRPDLQLAPLRARPEPAAQESPSLGVSGTGETRRRRQDDEEESEQESGRQGKRPRMSVKEMLE